jgi:WD40 repeat protein
MRRDAGAAVRSISRYFQPVSQAPALLVALLALCLVTGCQAPSTLSQATRTPSPTPTILVTRITTANAAHLKQLSSLNISDGIVRSVAWAPNGAMLAAGSAHYVRLLAASTEGRAVILPGDTGVVDALAWSPDGASLAAGDEDGGIYMWDVATRTLRITLRVSGPPVFAAAWSPDGAKLATGDGSGHVIIWDTATGAQLGAWFGDAHGRFHESSRPLAVYGVGWSPDGARLASTRYDGLLQFWDTRTGRNLAALPTSDKPNALAWSPDGRLVATGNDDGGAQIWNVATLASEGDFLARPLASWAYATPWSPDGTLLAISRGFGLLQVWDVASGKELAALSATSDNKQLRGVAWSPDELHLVTGGDDGTVRLWGVPA